MYKAHEQPIAGQSAESDNGLTHLVSVETLKKLQGRFAALGRVTVCLCHNNGSLIAPPSWGNRYSELIGTSPEGRQSLAQCLQRSVQRPGDESSFVCAEGLSLYTVPIVHDGVRLAVIVVGFRASAPASRQDAQATAARYALDPEELWESASEIDPYRGGSPEAIRRFAEVLADTVATLYHQAHRIECQLNDLRTIHAFTELLTGTLDLQEILHRTVRRVAEVMNAKASSIRLLDRNTNELLLKAVYNLSDEYLKKGPVFLHENAIDATAFAGEAVHIIDAAADPRIRYPENARREGIVSGLCVPMSYRGETVGVIRVYTGHRYEFHETEESLLRSIGAQAAAVIITGRLWVAQTEAARFQRQMDAAEQIQHRMLPRKSPDHPRLDIGAVYDPTLQLGGDFYDFLTWRDGRLGVCVADVVGKGLPAALLMASIRSALRANAYRFESPERVMAAVNRHMCNDTQVSEFATAVFGLFSSDSATLTYCNAGHPPPWLFRGDDLIELNQGGTVIGVLPETVFDLGRVRLQPGDVIVMVTDGVTEAMNFEGQPYGFDRLRNSIRKHMALDAQPLAQQILWDVRRFAGLAEQSDDITIVTVKVR